MDIPRLHNDTIEDVKQRVDIVDVISERVVLKKRGKDFLGLCPFHEEKTPSFTVSPSKQFYYCFGCQTGGNAIRFLMEVGKQSFSEVVLDLARRYQVPIKTLEPQQKQELERQLSLREHLYEIVALTVSFFQHALRQRSGQQALDYLKTERQLGEETIQQFQLGYAPAGWDTLYRYLVEQKHYAVELVQQTGLIKTRKSGNGYIDQFRDRIMIPIWDTQGRAIAFGSRTLTDEKPKYLNSPDTPLFDKSKTLFALDKARNRISKQDQAVVVEGYFDAIALHSAGIHQTVASLGTAFSSHQVKLLLRYTESKQIVLNFDADTAGTKATNRTIKEVEDLVYGGQAQLRILNLPDGKDADEFLKSSPEAPQIYQELLQNAPLWLDWQIQQLLVDRDLKQADQFQAVAKEMVTILRRLEVGNQRTYYIRHCAELLAAGDGRLISLYGENLITQLKTSPGKRSPSVKPVVSLKTDYHLLERAEASLLRIYLHSPNYRGTIIKTLEEKDLLFSLSHHRRLWQNIIQIQQDMGEVGNQLLSLLQDHLLKFPDQMTQVHHLFFLDEMKQKDMIRTPLVIQAAIATLEKITCEKHKRYCQQQWQQLNPSTDVEKMKYYYQELQEAEQRIKALDRQRHFALQNLL